MPDQAVWCSDFPSEGNREKERWDGGGRGVERERKRGGGVAAAKSQLQRDDND